MCIRDRASTVRVRQQVAGDEPADLDQHDARARGPWEREVGGDGVQQRHVGDVFEA